MFFAYLMVCSGVWANLQSLGEMTIAFPTSGNYVDYAGRWVDPALAFAAGFAEWLGELGTSAHRMKLTRRRLDRSFCCRSHVLRRAGRLLGGGPRACGCTMYVARRPVILLWPN
jgi:hypothetical protein